MMRRVSDKLAHAYIHIICQRHGVSRSRDSVPFEHHVIHATRNLRPIYKVQNNDKKKKKRRVMPLKLKRHRQHKITRKTKNKELTYGAWSQRRS